MVPSVPKKSATTFTFCATSWPFIIRKSVKSWKMFTVETVKLPRPCGTTVHTRLKLRWFDMTGHSSKLSFPFPKSASTCRRITKRRFIIRWKRMIRGPRLRISLVNPTSCLRKCSGKRNWDLLLRCSWFPKRSRFGVTLFLVFLWWLTWLSHLFIPSHLSYQVTLKITRKN